MRRVVLLDVLDTVVHDPFHRALPAFFGLDLPAFLAQKHPTAWLAFERGEFDEAGYLASMFADGRAVDGPALRAHLRASYRYVRGMPELIDDLRAAGTEVHSLSNYPVWSQLIDDALGLGDRLPWTFVSWRTGVRKPDPRAYTGPAEVLGVAPSQLVFADDRARNVDAAARIGVDALRFTDAAALRAALVERGLVRPALRVVAGAVVDAHGRVLVARRGRGVRKGSWELPGGKVEAGESDADALRRELAEELGVEVAVTGAVTEVHHRYDDLTLDLVVLGARVVRGQLAPTEHDALRWVTAAELGEVGLLGADARAVPALAAWLGA